MSRDVVQEAIDSGHRVYGLNTLLGSGRDTAVEAESILDYQIQVIRYHHSGVGALLAHDEVRAVILARLIGFTRGGSGVRPDTARFYAELLNRGVVPAIPRDGSVGSSDLTQLAAVAAVAIGEGQALAADGTVVAGAEALALAGLEPLVLAPGEALALVSANAYSIGAGALELGRLLQLADLADTALALSLEATARYDGGGNLSPFSPAVQAAKAVDGQRVSAAEGPAAGARRLAGGPPPRRVRAGRPVLPGRAPDARGLPGPGHGARRGTGGGAQRPRRQPADGPGIRPDGFRRELPADAAGPGLRGAAAGTGTRGDQQRAADCQALSAAAAHPAAQPGGCPERRLRWRPRTSRACSGIRPRGCWPS